MDSTFLCISAVFRTSVDGVMTFHIREDNLFYSVDRKKCQSLLERPSQIHQEKVFNQISGHHMMQPSSHIKLTITHIISISEWITFIMEFFYFIIINILEHNDQSKN